MFEITMSGPAKNALGSEMMTFLLEKLEEAAGRAVLLTGTGDAFSAGLNLKEVLSLDEETMFDFLRLLERLMSTLYLYPAPTVALVNGHAIAGGCILALACDFRVGTASPKARIGLNELALGLRFPPRTLAIVRGRVPERHLHEVVLGAGLHAPEAARRLGLLDVVAEDAGTVAREALHAFASHPRDAYALTKRDLRGTLEGLCPEEDEERRLAESIPLWTAPLVKEKVRKLLAR